MKMQGMAKIRKVKAEMDQKMAAGRANYFSMKDGETAVVRFNCGEDEPYMGKKHFDAKRKGYSKCSGADCVRCYYRDRGQKFIGNASDVAVFNLIDTRWMHVEDDPKNMRKDGKTPRKLYTPCLEDASCKGCRRKLERERGGQKYWEMALTHAANLDTVNKQLSKKCKTCGKGKIIVTEYECPNCASVMEYSPPEAGEEETVSCGSCGETVTPGEILACSGTTIKKADGKIVKTPGCDFPERGSIMDCDIEVTRSGSDKNTSYNFIPQLPFSTPEDWMLECKPVDLAAVMKPPSPELQAKDLGMRNPFPSNAAQASDGEEDNAVEGGAESYEDEESTATEEGEPVEPTEDEIPF